VSLVVCLFPAHMTQFSCLAGAVLTHSPLTAATRVRYPASACEMVIGHQVRPGIPASSHTNIIRTQTSVPTSMINISLNFKLNLTINVTNLRL